MVKQTDLIGKKLNKIDICFIICTLFTLAPNNKFFNQIILNKNIYLGNTGSISITNDLKKYDSLFNFLNKTAIRQFAFYLIEPLLMETYFSNDKLNGRFLEQTCLLKIYLKKFKNVYKRYFFPENRNVNFYPTDKELNFFAIQSLLFLLGV